MPRRKLWLLALCVCAVPVAAQDFGNLQIHGFATQGFLFSSANNYLTMPSSRGSLQWTEGGISVNDPLSDNLRVGMQIHMYQMGQIGGPNIQVDWAYFYGKVEGHFLRGTGLGYYASTNPNGLEPNANMLAARIGFSF